MAGWGREGWWGREGGVAQMQNVQWWCHQAWKQALGSRAQEVAGGVQTHPTRPV